MYAIVSVYFNDTWHEDITDIIKVGENKFNLEDVNCRLFKYSGSDIRFEIINLDDLDEIIECDLLFLNSLIQSDSLYSCEFCLTLVYPIREFTFLIRNFEFPKLDKLDVSEYRNIQNYCFYLRQLTTYKIINKSKGIVCLNYDFSTSSKMIFKLKVDEKTFEENYILYKMLR